MDFDENIDDVETADTSGTGSVMKLATDILFAFDSAELSDAAAGFLVIVAVCQIRYENSPPPGEDPLAHPSASLRQTTPCRRHLGSRPQPLSASLGAEEYRRSNTSTKATAVMSQVCDRLRIPRSEVANRHLVSR